MFEAILLTIAAAAPATATTTTGNTCSILSNDYEQVQKAMASRWADSLGDNSAPRATLSEMRDNNDLLRAQMTLELMRARNCPLPLRAPTLDRYLTPALTCATAKSQASLDRKDTSNLPECSMSKWVPKDY